VNPFSLLRRAAKLAAAVSTDQEFRLAAVGVRSDGAIVQATNKAVRVPTKNGGEATRLWNTHAEARLCRKLDAGAVVLVARVNDHGWAMARPCRECLRLLERRRVVRVYFTIADHEYGVIDLVGRK
jgi:hypothetical protein